MIDEPKISCFEKVAKTRLAKEILRLGRSGMPQYVQDSSGASSPSRLGRFLTVFENARKKDAVDVGAFRDSAGNLRSLRTKAVLPNNPLARDIVLHNEGFVPVENRAYKAAGESFDINDTLDLIGGNRNVYNNLTGRVGILGRARYMLNRLSRRPANAANPVMNTAIPIEVNRSMSYLKRMFGNGPRTRNFGKLPLGNIRARVRSDYGSGNSYYSQRYFGVGDVHLGHGAAAASAGVMRGRPAILEHELGHAYGEQGDPRVKNIIARRLAVGLNSARRRGWKGLDYNKWTSMDMREADDVRRHALQESFATYAPQYIRGNRSAIRTGMDSAMMNSMRGSEWFDKATPEMQNVLAQLRHNYAIG